MKRSQIQLVLPLEGKPRFQPTTPASEELVQALAELLLEALGRRVVTASGGKGARNESEDNT